MWTVTRFRRSCAGLALAASALAGASPAHSAGQSQPAASSTLDRARVQDLLKQFDDLMTRSATADALALLEPLVSASNAVLLQRDPPLEADVHYALGRGYDRQSKHQEALEHYQRALDGYRQIGNRRSEALALRIIAQVHKNTGAYERGIALGEESVALYTALGDNRGAARATITLGAIHDSVGDHRRALESFERALPLYAGEKSHDVVNLMNEIGITQKNLGNYAEALRVYSQGLDLAREIDDTSSIIFLSLNLGVLYNTIGEPERAVVYEREALDLARRAKERRAEMILLMNLASTYWSLGDQQRALDALQADLAVARDMSVRNSEGLIAKDLGDIYSEREDFARARQYYDDALRLQREMGERKSIGSTLVGLADLTRRQGRTEEALRFAEEGVALAREAERPELEWTALRSLASAEAASGQTARAIEELRASTRIINDLRANVASDMSKVAYVDRRQEVFADLAALLIKDGRAGEALEAAEAGRARAFADLLKQRQILGKPAERESLAAVRRAQEDYQKALDAPAAAPSGSAARSAARIRGGDALDASVATLGAGHHELASLMTAQSPTIENLRSTAGRLHATLVEYLVGERQLLAWVVSPDGAVHAATVDVTRARLSALASEVRSAIDASVESASSRRAPAIDAPLRELGRLLIAPLDAWLPASPDPPVVIVPHGPLALVPFAALEDETGRSLIARHVLSFAPAASVFTYTGDKRGRAARGRALVVADPVPPADSRIDPLPWAREEGRLVAQRLRTGGGPSVRLLVGREASEARVKQEAGAYSILHFATHGLVAPERPLASSLLFGEGAGEDGYLRVDEIFNLDLQADLVVLSGCSTGLGKLTGDGIVGLTRAFLYAGTPTVVVSQWNVSDRATSVLMDRFYAELRRGASKAQALRAAALSVRKSFPHPAFWAAFEVVGEP